MSRRTAPRLLLAVAAALSLAACGGDEPAETGAEQPTSQPCESRPATADAPAEVSTDLSVAPEVPGSDEAPPCGLVISDVVVGAGPEAVTGSAAEVKYVGAFYETGEEFDSSWSRGEDETLSVTVGAGQLIPGFEQAIEGMHVGSRRMVTIPSELGYGSAGRAPIPGDATLVFVLDLVAVG